MPNPLNSEPPMQATMNATRVQFRLAEDGEAIGTAQQFAKRLNLPAPKVWSCLQKSEAAPVVLPTRTDDDRVLIVGAEGVDALLECAAEATP